MTYQAFLDSIPEYANDLKLNLTNLLKQTELTEQQTWGTVIAAAMAARQTALTAILHAEAAKIATPETQNAAKTAATVMGMNNIYYRFQHLEYHYNSLFHNIHLPIHVLTQANGRFRVSLPCQYNKDY